MEKGKKSVEKRKEAVEGGINSYFKFENLFQVDLTNIYSLILKLLSRNI